MAALAVAAGGPDATFDAAPEKRESEPMGDMPGMAGMAGMPDRQETAALPSVVSFPYRFPSPGAYRMFVQVKRRGRIETGTFDADVQ
jgi:hypothetical protein